ncbi:MAG: ABC transporter substrate-binding protein, partial [Hydrococcus sp. RU_2_2]|nr:ABC transporter substrate-binding protein [Hydrococcus sp. RU_2_2]
MSRHWIIRFFALLCSVLLIACNSSNLPAQPNTTEPIKSPNSSIESAQRVIALTSLTADIIERLEPSKLVGIAGSSLLRKDERFQNIPQVSEGQTPPNLEKIVALKPDLVIGAKGFSDLTLNKLKELGIPTLSTNINSWNALIEITRSLAQIIGADATPLLARYQTFLSDNSQASPSTLVLVSRQPILAPNQKSWAGDLLAKFNVKNVAAELQGNAPIAGYVTLSPEKILKENPELLLIVEPMGQKLLPEFKAEPFWNQLKATQRA